jgi:hypothetical protein
MPAGDHNFSGGLLCIFYIAGQGAGEKLKCVRLFRIILHGGDYFKNGFI